MKNNFLLSDLDNTNKFIPGYNSFMCNDNVDIELDIDKWVHKTEDNETSDDEFYKSDKAIVDDNLETRKDIVNQDTNGNGKSEILQLTRYSELYYTLQSYKTKYLRYLDNIDSSIKYYSITGNEGFLSFIKNALTGIVNVFGHMLGVIKVSLFSILYSFKRGELSDYVSSNFLTFKRLCADDNYDELIKFKIDVPQGMKGTYINALSKLDEFLDKLDMSNRASRIEDISKSILKDAENKNTLFTSTVNLAIKEFKTTEISMMYNNLGKIFTNSHDAIMEFGKAFSSQKEYKTVCDKCMDGDSYLRAVAGVYDRLQNTNDNLNKLLSHSNVSLSKTNLQDLSTITRYFAETFDMYAVVIQDRLRIDHNLFMVTRNIRRRLNM